MCAELEKLLLLSFIFCSFFSLTVAQHNAFFVLSHSWHRMNLDREDVRTDFSGRKVTVTLPLFSV